MNCETIQSRAAEILSGELDQQAAGELRRHLAECARCRDELAALNDLWLRLGLLPEEEPSEDLRRRFYTALAEAEREAGSAGASWWRRLLAAFGVAPGSAQLRRLAVAAPSLLLGVALGLASSTVAGRSEVEEMREQVDSLTRLVTLSLLRQDSASERLMGVSYGREAAAGDARVVEALIDSATRDPSVNVRLAAIDALAGLRPRPGVRERLAASLERQESPLVQAALVDYLLSTQPGGSAELRQRLIDNDNLDESVRRYLASADPRI